LTSGVSILYSGSLPGISEFSLRRGVLSHGSPQLHFHSILLELRL